MKSMLIEPNAPAGRLPRFHLAVSFLSMLSAFSCAADWPQRAHDARRTGASPDSPRPPFRAAWTHKIPEERVSGWAQPTIADGKVFVGTIEGVVHCWPLSREDYEKNGRKDLWSFQTGGALLNSPAYEGGRVFCGSADGCCYALAAEDGALVWKTETGLPGFSAAVLLAEGRVFIGHRGGVMCAFDQKDGSILWQTKVGAPFFAAAAHDDGRVYAASEDMIVRAFDAATGAILWESEPIAGNAVREYYPVVDSGKVIVRTQPYTTMGTGHYSYTFLERDEDKPLKAIGAFVFPLGMEKAGREFWEGVDLPRKQRFAKYNAVARELFAAEPETLTFHVLDAKTGKRAFISPVIFNCVNAGPGQPPLVGPDGHWYAVTTLTCMGNTVEVVKIDPATGDIVDSLQEYVGGETSGWGGKYKIVLPDGAYSDEEFLPTGWTGDEDTHCSLAGGVIWARHGHGGWDGLDIGTRKVFTKDAAATVQGNWIGGGHAYSGFAVSGRYLVGNMISAIANVCCIEGLGE